MMDRVICSDRVKCRKIRSYEAFLARYQVCPYILVNAVFRLKTLFYQTRYHGYPFITELQTPLFAQSEAHPLSQLPRWFQVPMLTCSLRWSLFPTYPDFQHWTSTTSTYAHHSSCTKLVQPACWQLLLVMSGIIILVRVLLCCRFSHTWPLYHRICRHKAAGNLTLHIRTRFCDKPHSRLHIPLRIRSAENRFPVRNFKEGRKGNDHFQLSVNDASRMSNAGCYARQSASFLFPILSQFSQPTMFLADKATSVGCTFGFNRK